MLSTLTDDVARVGGAAGRAFLVSLGHSDRALAAAVRSGSLSRPRRGWYSTWPAEDPRYRALRLGGRLTGLSAIRAMGGWVRQSGRMHVAVPGNASRLRCPRRRRVTFLRSVHRDGVRLHWTRSTHDADATSGVVSLMDALEVACLTEAPEDAVAAIDWARRAGLLDAVDLAELAARLPRSRRHCVSRSSGACHSLPESLSRTRLAAAGFRLREQVLLPDNPSPIDLLVENAVALEIDGDEFHRDRFFADRAKDLAATRAGLHALRPAARHVFEEWDVVIEAITLALSKRGVAIPVPPPSVNNSGQKHRARRLQRAVPRSISTRPPSAPPRVLNC